MATQANSPSFTGDGEQSMKKTFAQALKESRNDQHRRARKPNLKVETSKLDNQKQKADDKTTVDEDWTEISSVSSCEWPGSVTKCRSFPLPLSELRAYLHEIGLAHASISVAFSEISDTQPNDSCMSPCMKSCFMPRAPEPPVNLWEEGIDTRTHKAIAGRVKHELKSICRYRHIGGYEYWTEVSGKPWKVKQYPGKKPVLHLDSGN